MSKKERSRHRVKSVTKLALVSVSYVTLVAVGASDVRAQASPPAEQGATQSDEPPSPPGTPAQEAPTAQPDASPSPVTPAQQQPNVPPLPQVTVEAPRRKPRATSSVQTAQGSAPQPSPPQPSPPESSTPDPSAAIQAAWPASGTQDARTGTVGIYANSTPVATKINTPLIDIPQSLSVVTREFINDNSFQNLTDITRYVPGVDIHQGEGNRDELIIRGVDSSANFYVNGFRDDVQYFRDLYNAQSVEVLKGPSAITFGRASGGGLVNRTLKEADGQRIYEATAQTGSYYDRRFTLDAGQAVSETVATRFNAMYEGSDTFRQFGWLERYGVNPTMTVKVDDATKVRFSYEYFHDERTADRGNPSQGRSSVPPASTSLYPAFPFARRPNRILRQPHAQRCAGYREHRDGLHRPRFRKRIDREERDVFRRLQEILSERLSRQRPAVGGGQSDRYLVQSRRLQSHDQSPEHLQRYRLHLQRLHRAGVSHGRLRNGTRPASRHRRPQHRTISQWNRHRGGQSVHADVFRAHQFRASVSRILFPRRHHGRFQQPIPARPAVGLCARHDRDHALAAADRGGARRSLRRDGAGSQYADAPH